MSHIIIAIFLSAFSLIVSANSMLKTSNHQILTESNTNIEHSGRTDKDGCHRDRKAGTRHCH